MPVRRNFCSIRAPESDYKRLAVSIRIAFYYSHVATLDNRVPLQVTVVHDSVRARILLFLRRYHRHDYPCRPETNYNIQEMSSLHWILRQNVARNTRGSTRISILASTRAGLHTQLLVGRLPAPQAPGAAQGCILVR